MGLHDTLHQEIAAVWPERFARANTTRESQGLMRLVGSKGTIPMTNTQDIMRELVEALEQIALGVPYHNTPKTIDSLYDECQQVAKAALSKYKAMDIEDVPTPLAEATGESVDSWLDMESAPRDGTHIYCYWPHFPAPYNMLSETSFDTHDGVWWHCKTQQGYAGNIAKPMYWQPLPKMPAKNPPEGEAEAHK